MKFLENQFRNVDATEPTQGVTGQDRMQSSAEDDGNAHASHEIFNQNDLLKKLLEQEVSEGM